MSRIVYWLLNRFNDHHERKVALMRGRGMAPLVFTDCQELRDAFGQKRGSIVIISDAGMPEQVIRNIDLLSCLPEFKGVRFILSLEANYLQVKKQAALWCFRDIIPIGEPDELWMQRINFATGSESAKFQMPRGMLSVNEICSLSAPARVVGINETYLQIESPLKPALGSTLSMRGEICERFKCAQIVLKVVKRNNDRLNYRFSDSLLAAWEAPSADQTAIKGFLDALAAEKTAVRPRVFIVLKSQRARAELLPILEAGGFLVSSALHKGNIEHDPRYFSPDVVLIEDDLCRAEGGTYLKLLFRNLEERVPVVIVGTRAEQVTVPPDFPERLIGRVAAVNLEFPDRLNALVKKSREGLAKQRREDQLLPVEPENPASFNFVTFPGRIREIHPLGIRVTHAFPVNNFTLCQIHSPYIKKATGKAPFMKLTGASEGEAVADEQFIHGSTGYLTDPTVEDRDHLAKSISELCSQLLDHYFIKATAKSAKENAQDGTGQGGKLLSIDWTPHQAGRHGESPESGLDDSQAEERESPTPAAKRQPHPSRSRSGARNTYVGRRASVEPQPAIDPGILAAAQAAKRREATIRNFLVTTLVVGVLVGVGVAAAMLIEPDPQSAREFSEPFIRMKNRSEPPPSTD